ncbi:MAG: carbohydrate ABC transporter permease [Nitrospiraceae bacterium]
MKTKGGSAIRTNRLRDRWSDATWGYLCATPALLALALLALGPILAALWVSLERRLPIFGIAEFVGLQNYRLLLQDHRFWMACGTTLYFTVMSVAAELVLGLAIALLIDGTWRQSRQTSIPETRTMGHGWLQAVILLPWVIPTVVSARLWEWIYHSEYGLLNYLLLRAGMIREPVNWLGDAFWAIHAAILMDIWKATPFAALLLLAGLKTIPAELYQAARVDGAGNWAIFRRLTVPLLLPIMTVVLMFRTMDAFRVFDAVYVLTGGGPGNSTETLSIYAYKTLFQSLQFGYGSALASAMFVLTAMTALGYLILLRRSLRESTR